MPLLNRRLTDDLSKVFKYPVSITQSVKGFFREMDTYGRINQKTILETIIILSEYVHELSQIEINSQENELTNILAKMQLRLDEVEVQLKEFAKEKRSTKK